MSKSSRNIVRRAYMSNFTKKKKHRYIITEKGSKLNTYIQNNIVAINDEVNVAIQELSIKVLDRQLPYIVIESLPICFEDDNISYEDKIRRIRGMLCDITTGIDGLEVLKNEIMTNESGISHSIEFFANTQYNVLTYSNNNFDAKILTDERGLKYVFTDIFLDSAMFNSYSFLKNMNMEEKHEFGKKKLDFYNKRELSCFYRFDSEDKEKLLYYSLAFSCRTSAGEFDYDKYISLWNEFISEYYPNQIHQEKRVVEQLQQHADYGQLPSDLKDKIMRKDEGAYLVLRVNCNRTHSLNERIKVFFGMKDYHLGKIKIVNIQKYYEIQDMLRNLDVSAYKVIRPPKKKK